MSDTPTTHQYELQPEPNAQGQWEVHRKQVDPATLDPAIFWCAWAERDAAAQFCTDNNA